jgi:hypothetical protein
MGVGLLRRTINCEGIECPKLIDIPAPADFDIKKYKASLKNIFDTYGQKFEHTDDDNQMREESWMSLSTNHLSDIMSQSVKNNAKQNLCKAKLENLFCMHGLRNLDKSIREFMKNIRETVS